MSIYKWLQENTHNISEQTIAVTGTTGGLGRQLCRYLCEFGAKIIMLDRNAERAEILCRELLKQFPDADIKRITVDLEDMESVKSVTETLKKLPINIFIHNAGAYSIPRHKCSTGFDNVFQINFVSPYYMIRKLMPSLRERGGKVIAVGSIAHNYSETDPLDIDFSSRLAASKVYGNSKRYLMFSLFELFKNEKSVKLSIVHPGITFTNITAHYPKLIFAVIKYPMKLIFMSPKKAALSTVKGIFSDCGYHEWIGPRLFNIWGLPKLKKLKTCSEKESLYIGDSADKIYRKLQPELFFDIS